jgi:tetratricopeptide (TPR) repeat protein
VGGLEEAVKGKGRLFFLVGEPGIGKSRLADEVVRQARRRGVQVLVGRCWEAGGAPAYWPWVQSLRRYVRETEPDALRAQVGAGAAELAQIVPELRELLPGLPEPTSAEAEGARFRLFDATAEFLRNASLVRPILLVLDDLHAADAPSLLLLQFLARELGSARVLLLGAYRDVDPVPGQALTATLADVARESTTRRLLLGGLSERDVAEYLDRAAAAIGSRELAAALHEETEGNPLFLTETVRLLSLEGLEPEPSVRVIPQTVRDVIARRLAHLSEECNRTLLLGSVLGREFALDALARLGGVSQDALLETLDEAMVARVVSDVPGGPGRFRFAHVLIRDTLYDGLTTARRVSLHRLAVEALEALYGEDPGPHLAELAHHAVAGNDFDKGVLYARRAGDRALTLLAYEEAVRLYEVGLQALEPAGRAEPAKRYELLLALGHAQVRAGDGVSAKQTFLQAASVARQLERPEALARAALGYGGRFVWARAGSDERLVPLLREALAAADERDAALRARLLARLAAALRDESDREPRALLSQEAVDIARLIGDPATLAYALVARYAALWSPGSADERLAIATELVDLAQRIGDKEREVEGHGFRLHALLELGDVEAAEAQLAARARLTNEMHQPAQRWVQLVLESMRNVFVGNFSAAEETIHQAFELGERAQGDEARLTFVLQLFVLRREQGRLAEIESELESCASRYRIRSVHRCALSNLSIELGRAGEARRRLAELAAENFGSVSRDAEWLVGIAFLAETCGCLDDRGRAATLYRLLLPHSKLNVADGAEVSTGAVSRYLGILASTITRFDEAAQHFEYALAMNERMGARPWLAHTQHDYARMLLTRGGHADRRRAEELVEAALATYRELGMDAQVARISAVASTP